jgi:hypothetical protein
MSPGGLCGLWPTAKCLVAVIIDEAGTPRAPLSVARTPEARAGFVHWLATSGLQGLVIAESMTSEPLIELAVEAQLPVWIAPAALVDAIRGATGLTKRSPKYTATLLARWPRTPALRPYLRHIAPPNHHPHQFGLL